MVNWWKIALAVVVVLLLVALVVLSRVGGRVHSSALTGLWVGEPDFLESASLGSMDLYVGPGAGGVRVGYLVATDADAKIVYNQEISLSFTPWRRPFGALWGGKAANASVAVEARDSEGLGLTVPSRLEAALCVTDGSLVLHTPAEVWAVLVKDHAASAEAAAAWDDPASA